MPYTMCPICGAIMHLGVGDPAAWYAERHPDARFGDIVPEPCPDCFGPIAVGDAVVTRPPGKGNTTAEPGQAGSVSVVYCNAEFGNLYVVQLATGGSLTRPRAAIRKRRSGEG